MEIEMIYKVTLIDHRKVCNYCTIYIELLAIGFLVIIGISITFFIFVGILKKVARKH